MGRYENRHVITSNYSLQQDPPDTWIYSTFLSVDRRPFILPRPTRNLNE